METVQHRLATLEIPNSSLSLAKAQQNIEIWRSELMQNMNELSKAENLVISETSPEGNFIIQHVFDESKAKLESINTQLNTKYAEFAAHLDVAQKAENVSSVVSILIHNEAEKMHSLESEPLTVRMDRLKACEASLAQNSAIAEFSQTLEYVETLPEVKQKMFEVRSQLIAVQCELQEKLLATKVEVNQSNQLDSLFKLVQECQENIPNLEKLKPSCEDSNEVLQQKLAQIEDSLSCLHSADHQLEEVVGPLVALFPEKQLICQQLTTSLHERQQLLLVLKEEVRASLDELGKVEDLTTEIAKSLEHFGPKLEYLKQSKDSLNDKREVLTLAIQTRTEYLDNLAPRTTILQNLQAEHTNVEAKLVLDQFENVATNLSVR